MAIGISNLEATSSGPVGPGWGAGLRVWVALAVFFGFMVVGSAGYYFLESAYSWLDAVYMTVITVTTVGLLEVEPGLSAWGRGWTMFVILGGVISGAVALSLIVAAVVEGRIRGVLGRRQLERRIGSLTRHMIVCGYGKMGQTVACGLREAGQEVVIVDSSADRTAQAERDGMLYLLGDAQNEATLRAAGIERASALVATLPDDATNVFLTLTVRGLSASVRIIARAQESGTRDKLTKAGATRIVCPQTIGAGRIVDVLLRPAIVDFVEMAHDGVDLEMDQLRLRPGSGMAGQTLRELSLPSRVGAMVVAVGHPDGTALYNPGPEVKLAAGDTIVLIGKRGVAAAIEELKGPAGTLS